MICAKSSLTDWSQAGLVYEGAKAFATPRRLALTVQGVPVRQPDLREEKKGPRVGAPDNAIAGFLKSAGLKSIDEAKVQPDKKGDFYVALIERPGRPAIDVIAEIVPEVVRSFPWPKSMRWGERQALLGAAAALHRCHLRPRNRGAGHRQRLGRRSRCRRRTRAATASWRPSRSRCAASMIMSPSCKPPRWCSIRRGAPRASPPTRRTSLSRKASNWWRTKACSAEVAGLVEWPVVLMGAFDKAFLAIPDEVIRATIRNNQKCFVLRDPQTAKLVNRFILVANMEAADGGKAIVAGNERVIRARLSDAKFFYETDLKTRLEDRLPKFEHIVFHEKLGSQAERIARIEALAGDLRRNRRRRRRQGAARRAPRQGRPAHRSGRRIPRIAGPDGALLR